MHVTGKEIAVPRPDRPAITGCRVAAFAVGALLIGIVLSQIPDIIRYARISNM